MTNESNKEKEGRKGSVLLTAPAMFRSPEEVEAAYDKRVEEVSGKRSQGPRESGEENTVMAYYDFGRGRAVFEKSDQATSSLKVTMGSEFLWQTDRAAFYEEGTSVYLNEADAMKLKGLLP